MNYPKYCIKKNPKYKVPIKIHANIKPPLLRFKSSNSVISNIKLI